VVFRFKTTHPIFIQFTIDFFGKNPVSTREIIRGWAHPIAKISDSASGIETAVKDMYPVIFLQPFLPVESIPHISA
jgi:hypothetical protein